MTGSKIHPEKLPGVVKLLVDEVYDCRTCIVIKKIVSDNRREKGLRCTR